MTTAIDVLLPGQPGYPKRLEALGWESVLEVKGSLDATRAAPAAAVAIVGARAASRHGMDRAHAVAKHLAGAGVHVVSGGALGIDGAAHRGALDGGGTTTVVVGSGIDLVYPARHAALFADVVARGGALVSMFPRGLEPRRGTFVARNRLIAALADLVVVVEADVHSGSMSTARAAREQGRPIAACPGSPGCQRLLVDGAAVVETGADATAALAGAPRSLPVPVLAGDALAVRDAILAGAHDIDAIVRHTGLSVRTVLRALPQLGSFPTRLP